MITQKASRKLFVKIRAYQYHWQESTAIVCLRLRRCLTRQFENSGNISGSCRLVLVPKYFSTFYIHYFDLEKSPKDLSYGERRDRERSWNHKGTLQSYQSDELNIKTACGWVLHKSRKIWYGIVQFHIWQTFRDKSLNICKVLKHENEQLPL